ncbi:ABC transporter permease [Chitinophagaceae bacterium 26-R-25]|nr:ABC transporter permease [Chitinophagaceae bacterium 26-R-25]
MNTIFKITFREWKRIFSLPAHYWVLIVIPPLLFFLYAYIYEKQKAEKLPVAIFDEDHSAISRQLIFLMEQTESIHFTTTVNSYKELQTNMREGKIMAAVYFPQGLERNIKSRNPATVGFYTNASFMVTAKLMYKDAANVLIAGGLGVVLQKLEKKGMPADKAMALVQPIKLITYPLYNPQFNYQEYLVPGLITVAMQMIIILIGVLLLNYEWKTNSIHELIKVANGSASNIIIGKLIAHLAIAWLNFILIAGIIFPIFEIGNSEGMFSFFVLYTLLAIACLGVGFLLSSIFMDVMLCTDIAIFYTSPAFVFSGYTFPRWAMPWYDQYYAQIMPYAPFLDAFIKVNNMQLPLRYAQPEMLKLLCFIIITYPLAIIFFQKKCNQLYHTA